MEQLNLPININSNLNCVGGYPEIENRLIVSDGKLYLASLEYDEDCRDDPLVEMLDPRIDWVLDHRATGTRGRINGEYDDDLRIYDHNPIIEIVEEIINQAEMLEESAEENGEDMEELDESDFIERVDAESVAELIDPHEVYEFLLGKDAIDAVKDHYTDWGGYLGRKVSEAIDIVASQYHILPISLYDHSGYHIFSGSYRDWDCGVIGYALCDKDKMTYEEFETELDNALSDYDDLLNGRVYTVVVEEVNIVKCEDHNDKEYLEISRGDFEDSISGLRGYDGDDIDFIKYGLSYFFDYDWMESNEQYKQRRNYDGEPLQAIVNKAFANNE